MDTTVRCSLQLLLSVFLLSFTSHHHVSARLRKNIQTSISESAAASRDFVTFFYPQTLDHFNYKPESYTTFNQRYAINFKHWSGPNTSAPILVFFGAEENIDDDIRSIGFLTDNASQFKALLLYIEHRYYGKSVPFGSSKEALKNASSLGYFNSAQALADYAAVIMHVQKNYSAKSSPVIVIGGSYGGLLASWFRLKYPHIALGALASSAPILYFDDSVPLAGFYSIITKDFKETSESCYKTISESWAEIEKVASKPNGLSLLSQKFMTCNPLKKSSELKDYLDSLYTEAAQFDYPPTYRVSLVCGGVNGAPEGTDILGRIFAGVVAYLGERSCYDLNLFNDLTDETSLAWAWQTCSEIVIRIGHDRDSMFPAAPFNLDSYIKDCKSLFGVLPQPEWVTTYYGGHDLKLILRRFASNIIFSNGLRDPYSSGGVLENISDSIVAISTTNGSHCLDLHQEKPSDPRWLVMQRKTEVEIIQGWISKYHDDLQLKDPKYIV
ncbi:hypothetical protein P3X46_009938 [Hevea brasiliensis]|uniref:Lysosomal Pro-X carboxypeptidase n=1 Tax=Hevea brasiliensis TaxID=3981 RepID=A0ABQ9MF77_HEVBR|nr:uncharacterized protein LOC110643369 [Hevea brasiliensis]KAJ9178018.1 hypothetical protein P3X46_009938 [Hevea brasiliensis]